MGAHHLALTETIAFVERHGYALLFWWVFIEQCALPIPSVPLLLASGALIRTGRLHYAPALACCLAGSLLADTIWFALGRRRGRRILRLLCRISLEPDSCVRQTENAFLKFGMNSLLIAKFVPGLNAVAAPLAGNSTRPYWQFLLYDGAGVAIWSGSYLIVGFLFSTDLERMFDYAARMGSSLLVLVVVLFGLWIGRKYVQRRLFLRQLKIDRIAPEELRDRLKAGEVLSVIDLRGHTEASVVIPGAIRISLEDLPARSHEIPRDHDIILFCSCPNEASSARAALQLKSLGFPRVRPLQGGAEAWEKIAGAAPTEFPPKTA